MNQCFFFLFFCPSFVLLHYLKHKKQIQLAGPLTSSASILACKPHTSFPGARCPARKKENLPAQRAVIFTQDDFWTARSLLRRAPETSGKKQMFLLLLMQNRWERLFKTFFSVEGRGGGRQGGVTGWGCHRGLKHAALFSLAVIQNIYRAMPPWNTNERSVRRAHAWIHWREHGPGVQACCKITPARSE